ncbi:hypothetical protein Tco_0228359 [Tanacetum coccineum]
MFSIRIHHGGSFQRIVLQLGYTGEFEPVYYNYLRPLSTLDEGLHDLACEEDVRCLVTLVKSFKLLEVYIEHGYTVVNSYQRLPPHVREIIEDISDPESVCDSITPRSLPQHDSSTHGKDSVCESVTPRCMSHGMLTPHTNESVITYDTQDHVLSTTQSLFSDIYMSFVSGQPTGSQVIEDVMRQLSFEKTELDGEAGFGDVIGSGIDNSGLSHDESFRVDDLDLTIDLNVSQTETQVEVHVSEVFVSKEADVRRTEVLVFEEVGVGRTKEHIVERVIVEEVVNGSFEEDVEHGNGQANPSQ